MNFYGLTSVNQIEETVVAVVGVLGGGANAISLMLGTCAAETNLGKAKDRHSKSGYGLFQLDEIAIRDVIERTREHHRDLIEDRFGVNLDEVEPRDLNFSPLLSAIFCRLHYKLVPEPLPDNMTDRANYWKKHYNKTGKGTPAHYLQQAEQLFHSDLYNAIND